MSVKQISVFLENKPGQLAELTKVISDSKINLRALSLAEAEDFGVARLIVDDVYNASTTLKEKGFISSTRDVLAISISDEPGSFSKVLKILGDNGINLEYMYSFTTKIVTNANMVLKVNDEKKAKEILIANGVKTISQDELAKL